MARVILLPVEVGLNPLFGFGDRNFSGRRFRNGYRAASGIGNPCRIDRLLVIKAGCNFYFHLPIGEGQDHIWIVRRCDVLMHKEDTYLRQCNEGNLETTGKATTEFDRINVSCTSELNTSKDCGVKTVADVRYR